MNNITRKALLIGCAGKKGQNFLNGVQSDLYQMRRFLLSESGGNFTPDEVITRMDPTRDDLHHQVQSASADYLYIYFSGHGFTDHLGQRNLCFTNFSVSDIFLLGNCPRQLVLADVCRDHRGPWRPAAIGGIGEGPDSFEGSPVRALFDHWIASSPEGKIIIHATGAGMSARDTATGGVFTKAWLNIASQFTCTNDYAPVQIPLLLQHASEALTQARYPQYPEIVYSRGNLQVPFAVAMPAPQRSPVETYFQAAAPVAQPGAGPLVMTGLLLLALALWDN